MCLTNHVTKVQKLRLSLSLNDDDSLLPGMIRDSPIHDLSKDILDFLHGPARSISLRLTGRLKREKASAWAEIINAPGLRTSRFRHREPRTKESIQEAQHTHGYSVTVTSDDTDIRIVKTEEDDTCSTQLGC